MHNYRHKRNALTENEWLAIKSVRPGRQKARDAYWSIHTGRDLVEVFRPIREMLQIDVRGCDDRTNVRPALHVLVVDMQRRLSPYWDWSEEEWQETLTRKWRGKAGMIQNILAQIAFGICGFALLNDIKPSRYKDYAVKRYGNPAVFNVSKWIKTEVDPLSLSNKAVQTVEYALYAVMLVKECYEWTELSVESLAQLKSVEWHDLQSGISRLELILTNKHPLKTRRHDPVPAEWRVECKSWRSLSPSAPETSTKHYHNLMRCGRWLSETYPGIVSAKYWTSEIARAYVQTILVARVGDWTINCRKEISITPCLLSPRTQAQLIVSVQKVFLDLQNWDMIPRLFSPKDALAVPASVLEKIKPDPRPFDRTIWVALAQAALRFGAADLPSDPPPRYQFPLAMVRAMAAVLMFSGLRANEICRLSHRSLVWTSDYGPDGEERCRLIVPPSKGSGEFSKSVDAQLGLAVDAWRRVRENHPKIADPATKRLFHPLFVHQGRMIDDRYLRDHLLPALFRKACVEASDNLGAIKTHRIRTTIATALYQECNWTFEEVQQWLGHASPQMTSHYVTRSDSKGKLFPGITYDTDMARSTELLLKPFYREKIK